MPERFKLQEKKRNPIGLWLRQNRLNLVGGAVLSTAAVLGVREIQNSAVDASNNPLGNGPIAERLVRLKETGQTEPISLVPGCQIESLAMYPPGTPLRQITSQITSAGANPRLWFVEPGSADFLLFDPDSEERSAKTHL